MILMLEPSRTSNSAYYGFVTFDVSPYSWGDALTLSPYFIVPGFRSYGKLTQQ
jgi:hypothetical protein